MDSKPWLAPAVHAGFATQREFRERLNAVDPGARRTYLTERVVALAGRMRKEHPGYAELYSGLSEITLPALPVLHRSYFAEHQRSFLAAAGTTPRQADDFLDRPFLLGSRYDADHVMFSSSGSSGQRKVIPVFLRDFARSLEAFHHRAISATGAERLLYIGLVDRHNGGNAWMFYLRNLMDVRMASIFADPEELLRVVLDYQPQVVLTRPSALTAIAECAANRGARLPRAHLISVGEPLSAAQAADIGTGWGSAPHNSYSTVETGPIGYQPDPEVPVLQLYEDLNFVEVIGADGRAVTEPSVPGRLLVTTAYADRLPFIRYDIGDYVMWVDDTRTRLTFPLGRADGGLVVSGAGGRTVVPELAVLSIDPPGLRRLQIEQYAPDTFHVRYESSTAAREDLGHVVAEALRSRLVAGGADQSLRISTEEVQALRPDPATGKLKQVISHVPLP